METRGSAKSLGTSSSPWVKDDTVLEDTGFKAPIYYLDPDQLTDTAKGRLTEWRHDPLPASKGSYYVQLTEHACRELCPGVTPCYVSVAFLKALGMNKVAWSELVPQELTLKKLQKAQKAAAKSSMAIEKEASAKSSMAIEKEASAKSSMAIEKEASGIRSDTVSMQEEVSGRQDEVAGEDQAQTQDQAQAQAVENPMNLNFLDETAFIQDWKSHWYGLNLWDDNEMVYGDSVCYVPIRLSSGVPEQRRLDERSWSTLSLATAFKNRWYNNLNQLWVKQTGHAWRPSRCSHIALKHPMVMYVEEIGERISESDWERYIQDLNDLGDVKELVKVKVQLNFGRKAPPPQDYIAISTNPFGLYTTYIHQYDWNSYMAGLKEDQSSPCRQLVDIKRAEACQSWGKVVKKQDAHTQLMKKEKSNLTGRDRELYNFRTLHEFASFETPYFGYGCVFTGTLRPENLRAVRSKRSGAMGQNVVMDGSAPTLALSLGWGKSKLNNSLSPAEWLHLSAFSWGTAHQSTPGENGTCQTPDNLIFGTSETNSFMLRYEKAWQNLFIFEDILRKQFKFNVHIEGKLKIITNNNADMQSLEMDVEKSANNYTWITLQRLKNSKPVAEAIKAVTTKYKFVAYSVNYNVSITCRSFLMDAEAADFNIKFYPFQRPFYHRVESALDNRLFMKLRSMATAKAKINAALSKNSVSLRLSRISRSGGQGQQGPKETLILPMYGPKPYASQQEDTSMAEERQKKSSKSSQSLLEKRPSELSKESKEESRSLVDPNTGNITEGSDPAGHGHIPNLQEARTEEINILQRGLSDTLLQIQQFQSNLFCQITQASDQSIQNIRNPNATPLSHIQRQFWLNNPFYDGDEWLKTSRQDAESGQKLDERPGNRRVKPEQDRGGEQSDNEEIHPVRKEVRKDEDY